MLEREARRLALGLADPSIRRRLVQKMRAVSADPDQTGTPAFFVNGRLLTGAQPLESFTRVIDEELSRTR